MVHMLHPQEIKIKAEKLRVYGKSYSYITRKLGVPKSTLSTWFNPKYKDIFRTRQKEHLKKARKFAIAALKKRNALRTTMITNNVRKELKDYPIGSTVYMKTILAMLYWAEGAKFKNGGGLTIVNTDPDLLSLYISLLRKCFVIDENKFWIRLHIHHYHDKNECLRFWSRILKVPLRRFAEPHIKPRSKTKKFRENFMGICSVYNNGGNARRELLELGRQLARHYS